MTRTPLRPLARILEARSRGENPDAIERENIRLRHEEMRDRARRRAEGRLLVLAVAFFCAFGLVGGRMALLAQSEPGEPRTSVAGARILAQRADITDREGRILATNFDTHSLYAQPPDMVDPVYAAEKLVEIFPDLDRTRLIRDFTGDRKFLWIRKTISPEQQQAVHDIGEPGLLFGPREMRLYPNGRLAAHVLGGASFGREGVHAAEVVGVAGVEKHLDERLRDPARAHEPLTLSLDLSVQAAMEQVLHGGMKIMNAKGASGILMEVETGEVVAVASLPDFDPNDRPALPTSGNQDDSPLFNRAVQGVYELGSVFKVFTIAQALDLGLATPDTMVNTETPLTWGRFRIRDFRNYGPELSLAKVIIKSSNVGTARIAMDIGAARQKAFLGELGFMEASPLEITEASGSRPLLPKNWSEISTMTISYGHGLSTSPMHLAAAYGVPDPVADERVAVALQMEPGERFDPQAVFDHFLEQQNNEGMDPKWMPDFIRIEEQLPMSETNKVLVRHLRKEGYNLAANPDMAIWFRERGDQAYKKLTPDEFERLKKTFEDNGRAQALVA